MVCANASPSTTSLGARFAKWRAVIDIGAGIPTAYAIEANAQALARYAALCQEAGIVPIVEPEVLMDGDHPLGALRGGHQQGAADRVFDICSPPASFLEGMVLKPNMVMAGKKCARKGHPPEQVAEATVRTLKRHVPSRGSGHRLSVGRPEPDGGDRCI